jgi:hypothetical protein
VNFPNILFPQILFFGLHCGGIITSVSDSSGFRLSENLCVVANSRFEEIMG